MRERFIVLRLAARRRFRQLAGGKRQNYAHPMRLAFLACMILALAACHKPARQFPETNETAAQPQAGPVKGLDRTHRGTLMPDISFDDPDGHQTSLTKFSGKPLLVNLWATWCAPCVKELPTLDRLAQSHEKDGALSVLAVSEDFGPHPSVVAFLDTHKIRKLAAYQDAKSNLSSGLGAEVLPTSILFDAQGHELWRYVGDLDWTSPQAAKLLSEAAARRKS
jgi:thiol-disulfide isomerase/thioredoxin